MEEKDPKKIELYLKQKALLEQFLQTGAISKAQFDKSFGCLTEKMGMEAYRNAGCEIEAYRKGSGTANGDEAKMKEAEEDLR